MGKYEEEIYGRAEHQFASESAALAWLSSFERTSRGATAYTRDALKVRDELLFADTLKRDYKRTGEVIELQGMKREAESLKFYGRDVASDIQTKIDKISKELAALTEKRREERLIEEANEKEAKRIERREMALAERIAKEQERLQSDDKRKRRNAKKHLDKMRERGEINV